MTPNTAQQRVNNKVASGLPPCQQIRQFAQSKVWIWGFTKVSGKGKEIIRVGKMTGWLPLIICIIDKIILALLTAITVRRWCATAALAGDETQAAADNNTEDTWWTGVIDVIMCYIICVCVHGQSALHFSFSDTFHVLKSKRSFPG